MLQSLANKFVMWALRFDGAKTIILRPGETLVIQPARAIPEHDLEVFQKAFAGRNMPVVILAHDANMTKVDFRLARGGRRWRGKGNTKSREKKAERTRSG